MGIKFIKLGIKRIDVKLQGLGKRIGAGLQQRRIDVKQVTEAEKLIRIKSRGVQLKEREKQVIKFAKEKEKAIGKEKLKRFRQSIQLPKPPKIGKQGIPKGSSIPTKQVDPFEGLLK